MLNELGVLRTSPQERALMESLDRLSSSSGTHSPSLATMQQSLPEVHIDIDACFLSNPLATELFWSYFNREVVNDQQLFKRILEAFPSLNSAGRDFLSWRSARYGISLPGDLACQEWLLDRWDVAVARVEPFGFVLCAIGFASPRRCARCESTAP